MRATIAAILGVLAAGAPLGAAGDAPSVSIDRSYGDDGRGPAAPARGAEVVDAEGRILRPFASMSVPNDFDAGLMRLAADGSLDAAFADEGTFRLAPPPDLSSESAVAAGVDAGGAILLLSAATPPVTYSPVTLRLTRLLADGTVDAGFGTEGSVVVASGLDLWSGGRGGPMVVLPGGDALVVVVDPSAAEPVTLRRVTPAGEVDAAFAGSGAAALPLSPGLAEGVALTTDGAGRILAAGVEPTSDELANAFLLVRLTANGERDTSFGDAGVATVGAGTPGRLTSPSLAASSADGGLYVVAGNAWEGSALASGFVSVLRADSPADAARLGEDELGGSLRASVSRLAAEADGRVLASVTQWSPDFPVHQGAITLRLRFDGEDGTTPPPPPPPPARGAVVTAAWTDVQRVVNSHGKPSARLRCVLHVENTGDLAAASSRVRVLLTRDAGLAPHEQRLKSVTLPVLAAGASVDVPLRLRVSRRAAGRRLLLVRADAPEQEVAISGRIP